MAKKKNNNNENRNTDNENNSNEGDKKNDGEDAGKKDLKGFVTVVLKVDMHCEGCATKVVKLVRAFEGVETVKAETSANKLTIVGSVDPSKIRDKLSQKTKKKVDLVSPQPKKEKDKETKEENNKPKDKNNVNDKKPKEKEAPVTTAVLMLNLHCQGCIKKVHKTVSKTKGVMEMTVDKQKDLVTVKGTMDVKALTENLKDKLKRPVDIVPPKKQKEEKESNSGDNNNGGGGGKKKKGSGGGGDGDGDGGGNGGGKGGQEAEGGWKMEGIKMNYMMGTPGPGFGYGYGYQYPMHGGYEYGYPAGGFHAPPPPPQMFSDENPNACAVM